MTAGRRRTLGRYELIDLLGRGSATEAWRAKSFGVEGFEKTLVVKRVLPELAASQAFMDAFLEHVQRAMRLSHANLTQVFDLGHVEDELGSAYYLATEHVAGMDVETLLERALAAGASPPLSVSVYLALEVAKALDHAHRRRDEQLRPLGLVHGAIAPHNVRVSFDGDVKLTDFGVTRALLSSAPRRDSLRRLVGASSPEQASGAEPTVASDVFSLGSFLYFALTGVNAFVGASTESVRRRVAEGVAEPITSIRHDVPDLLAGLVHRALSPEPEERFSSVSALHEELLACTYACHLRCSASDLAAFLDAHRDAESSRSSEGIGDLMARPITLPPPPALEADLGSDEGHHSRTPGVRPLTGFGDLRHVSALVLHLRQRGVLPPVAKERLSATLARYGGSVVSSTDHQVVALFGLDRSDGRDLESAVRCGLVLARGLDTPDVAPSVGIDAGRLRLDQRQHPLADERTARLLAQASALAAEHPRVVQVARRLEPSLRARFSLEPLGEGLRVLEFSQDGYADSFVGRRVELHQLGETLVRAARGELRLFSIVGDPGIGKTRLAVEMQRRLTRGVVDLHTFLATCPPRGRELPLSGAVAMLRRVCGVRDGDPPARIEALEPRLRALGLDSDEIRAVLAELGAPAPSTRIAGSNALRGGVMRMMQSLAEDRFTVFVWDDAHELDAATCELIGRVASRLSGSRIALALSARPDPGAPFHALPLHAEVRLQPLPPEDAARLVTERLGAEPIPEELTSFLAERALGQPMFIEELLRQLVEGRAVTVRDGTVTQVDLQDWVGVPRTLRALTGDRLRRLSDDDRNLFVAAAVLEPPVSADLLARMVDVSPSEVDRLVDGLVARGLLSRDGPSAFGFPSPLAREVVLTELDPDDLARLHRHAAGVHVRLLGSRLDEEADRVGFHLAAAGDRDAAADMYARAGLHALAHRQLDHAVLDLSYAFGLADLEARDPAQTGNWLRALSTAVGYVRSGPNLTNLIQTLVERVKSGTLAPALALQMRIDLARILGALDMQLDAEALLEGGVADAASQELVTEFLSTRAALASGRGDFRLARRALDPLARLGVTDRGELHGISLSMAHTLAAAGKVEAAATALADAHRLAPADDPFKSLERAATHTALCQSAGRYREAAEASVQAAAQAEELGLSYEVAASLCEQAAALTRLGELDRARVAVASALRAAEETGAERVCNRSLLIQGLLEARDHAALSLDQQRGYIALAESRGWILDALLGRSLLATMALRAGANGIAREELLLASRIATSTGNHAFADQCAADLARL